MTTPTDPTQSQVWVTKNGDNFDFEFYIPRGPKGDPGGLVLGTTLSNTTSLDQVTASGIYRLTATYTGLSQYNFPRDNDTGILEVFERIPGQTVTQVWHSVTQQGRVFYERTMTNTGTWSTWRAFNSTRVDQNAGRVIYQFDDVNNRDQMIYGDTGERDVRTDLGNGTYAALKLRREGSMVTLTGVSWKPPADSTSNALAAAIPVGFRNTHTISFAAADLTANVMALATLGSSGGALAIGGNQASRNYNFHLAWQTTDVWPTVLPGTASGSIPNT